MKERPILFNTQMILAILDGRKTQTRRIAKVTSHRCKDGFITPLSGFVPRSIKDHISYCPYGKPGDKLWVRETWQGPLFYDEIPENWNSDKYKTPEYCYYKASGDSCDFTDADDNFVERWRPSIHMPRWASRILLGITDVRLELLNDISNADAISEGLKAITKDARTIKHGIPDRDGYPGNDNNGWEWCDWDASPVLAYKKLWESIEGAGSWDLNPFVWVLEFNVISQNERN